MGLWQWLRRRRALGGMSPAQRKHIRLVGRRLEEEYGGFATLKISRTIIGEEPDNFLVRCNRCGTVLKAPKAGLREGPPGKSYKILKRSLRCECGDKSSMIAR